MSQKAYRRSTELLIIKLGNGLREVVNLNAPAALPLKKEFLSPI